MRKKQINEVNVLRKYTPENERLEPKVMEVDGSDDFPFQLGDFQVNHLSFQGGIEVKISKCCVETLISSPNLSKK